MEKNYREIPVNKVWLVKVSMCENFEELDNIIHIVADSIGRYVFRYELLSR